MINKTKQDLIESLLFQVDEKGIEVLECLHYEELVKPLILKDWKGTGGKVGYDRLSEKYNLSLSKIRRICKEIKKELMAKKVLKSNRVKPY